MHTLRVTPALLAELRERRIFHHIRGFDRLRAGDVIVVPPESRIAAYSQLLRGQVFPAEMDAFSYSNSELAVWVRVGRYSSLAAQIGWMGGDHPAHWASTSPVLYRSPNVAGIAYRMAFGEYETEDFALPDMTVTIGHDVWIGGEATIAPGITIGDGAVVGARALVLKDVPPYAIVVGHPARILRLRFPEPLVERFIAARWWRYSPSVVGGVPLSDPERFLDAFEEKVARDAPEPMVTAWMTDQEIVAACEALAGA